MNTPTYGITPYGDLILRGAVLGVSGDTVTLSVEHVTGARTGASYAPSLAPSVVTVPVADADLYR